MKFLRRIRDSIYSPQFYVSIPKRSLSRSIFYFYLLILVSALIHGLFLFPSLLNVKTEVKNGLTEISGYYPSNLEVTVKEGKVSTNVEEPYVIKMPESSDVKVETEDLFENLIVIDTKTPYSASQFKEYNTVAWVTEDSIFYNSDNRSEIRSFPLTEVKSVIINKKTINQLMEQVNPWLKFIAPILGILGFIGLILLYSFRFTYNFFLALLIFLMSKIFKWNLSYKSSYIAGLYGMTLGVFIDVIKNTVLSKIIGTNVLDVPFLFTIVTLAVVFVNVNQAQNYLKKTPSK